MSFRKMFKKPLDMHTIQRYNIVKNQERVIPVKSDIKIIINSIVTKGGDNI